MSTPTVPTRRREGTIVDSTTPDTVKTLPIEWVGSWTGSSWGVISRHHPLFQSHAENPEAKWHPIASPCSMKVLRQEGRSLLVMLISDLHQNHAVGTLSVDGTALVLASQQTDYQLTIDGNRMFGSAIQRAHGDKKALTHFATGMIELEASA